MDYKADEFQALVFEFTSNGSLEELLLPRIDGHHQFRSLSFIRRLNIAIDVACALEYLHHQCQMPIVHCDLKPSNILLDDEMCAHVGDFGLAKFLSEVTNNSNQNDTQSVAVKGSIGYVAPEYGMGGKVSTRGDVYSYGIILLEMFTGKRPTSDLFKEGENLRNFTVAGLPDKVMEIVDPFLLEEEEGESFHSIRSKEDKRSAMKGCLVSVLEIGVACSAESPEERAMMGNVLIQMHNVRDRFFRYFAMEND